MRQIQMSFEWEASHVRSSINGSKPSTSLRTWNLKIWDPHPTQYNALIHWGLFLDAGWLMSPSIFVDVIVIIRVILRMKLDGDIYAYPLGTRL